MSKIRTNQKAILLCGGEINHANLPIGTNRSNAMIPVNGKPVIGWILDSIIERKILEVTIVLTRQNTRLHDFLTWAYHNRLKVDFAFVEKGGTILHSLIAGLDKIDSTDRLHLILGDTLVKDENVFSDEDYMFVGPYDSSENWCLVETSNDEGIINGYFDKEINVPDGLRALVGYYHFTDTNLLKDITTKAIRQNEYQLSTVFKNYGEKKPIKVREAANWLDFGHIKNFSEAKCNLLESRYFNSLEINRAKGTIEKRSEKNEKLIDELNWYQGLPDSLKVLAPRILNESDLAEGKVKIVQEYYGYPNLAELYVFGDLDSEIWHSTIQALFKVVAMFREHTTSVADQHVMSMYGYKTFERLDLLKQQNPDHWNPVLEAPRLCINGEEFDNVLHVKKEVIARVKELSKTTIGSILHGDFCFGNILYDITNQIVRVIDPRGSFGEKGIYGDHRYDLAKLRHSICGRYDFLIARLFTFRQKSLYDYEYEIFSNTISDQLGAYFDQKLVEYGVNLGDIKFIESLLFISMVPYHAGNPERQMVMYLQGVKLLQESLSLASNSI